MKCWWPGWCLCSQASWELVLTDQALHPSGSEIKALSLLWDSLQGSEQWQHCQLLLSPFVCMSSCFWLTQAVQGAQDGNIFELLWSVLKRFCSPLRWRFPSGWGLTSMSSSLSLIKYIHTPRSCPTAAELAFCCVAVQAAQRLSTEHSQESAPDIWDSGCLQTRACLKDSFTQVSHSQSYVQNQWDVPREDMGGLLQICGTRLKADWHEPNTQSCLTQSSSLTWIMWLLHELRLQPLQLGHITSLAFACIFHDTCRNFFGFFWDLTALWNVNLAPGLRGYQKTYMQW